MITRGAVRDATRDASRTFRVVQDLDPSRWSAFVDRHPQGSIFHTPEMHRVLQETERHSPGLWAALDDTGEIHALFTPVSIAAWGGPLRSLTTRTVSFAGPLVAPGETGVAAFDALLRAYRGTSPRRSLFTEIRNTEDHSALIPTLEAAGFEHERHLNFLIDLSAPEEEIWRRVSSTARRNINKARRVGVEVEIVTDPEGVAAAYRVLEDVYHRIRVPLADRSMFEAAFRILRPLGRLELGLARFEDQTIGVMVLLFQDGVTTYWYAGTLREFATCRAGDLLAWHAITTGRARGCHVLDFGGAGKPDEPYGVREFKAKYGGRQVDYGRDVWVPSRARLRAATTGYEVVRRFL